MCTCVVCDYIILSFESVVKKTLSIFCSKMAKNKNLSVSKYVQEELH
ncbi:hypothetical protein ELI_4165 [Eubacterium callanderi]|uniref:Uncharacterized protein n=1 Tax=Eubacterium callanderi TaxID=53442 RepID=E3GQ58_9FIRM|nr:hypothetical protein ELI_4165 [Eubacterium callanderi]